MRPRTFVLLASIASLAYACGGVDSGLISGGNGDDDDDTSSAHDAGSSTTVDGSTPGRDGGETHVDGGGGGGGEDASTGGHKDGGGGPKDGSVGPVGPIVPATCGTQNDGTTVVTCNATTPTCCANQQVTDDTVYSCTTNPAACTGTDTTPVQCRDDRDCNGGRVCCGILNNVYDSLKCVPAAECVDDGGAALPVRFCTPTVSDPCGSLPTPGSCSASTLLPGFNRCY
ncbi:MAG TPA: hypothetical protein VF407_23040 [Polyangiaceae bacterium]